MATEKEEKEEGSRTRMYASPHTIATGFQEVDAGLECGAMVTDNCWKILIVAPSASVTLVQAGVRCCK